MFLRKTVDVYKFCWFIAQCCLSTVFRYHSVHELLWDKPLPANIRVVRSLSGCQSAWFAYAERPIDLHGRYALR